MFDDNHVKFNFVPFSQQVSKDHRTYEQLEREQLRLAHLEAMEQKNREDQAKRIEKKREMQERREARKELLRVKKLEADARKKEVQEEVIPTPGVITLDAVRCDQTGTGGYEITARSSAPETARRTTCEESKAAGFATKSPRGETKNMITFE